MKPKIGLALGSGGARGLAHIGVIKALQEHRIHYDLISGSSMGSLVGALIANNNDIKMIEKLAVTIKRKHWLDLTVPKLGFVSGEKVREMTKLLTHGKNIEDLAIPLGIVATDIETGERVVLKEGNVADAVRASISIPGIFVPHKVEDRLLVDGGVVERVPVRTVREMGADFIIAVDVGLFDAKMKVNNIMDVISQSINIMEREIYQRQISTADYVIRPNVGYISTIDFSNVEDIIEEGYHKGLECVEQIKELIEVWEEN